VTKTVRALSVLALSMATACAAASDDSEVGTQEGAWDAESATNETDSTHLWIVNRALDILARHGDDPVAARAIGMLNDASCRTNWQQGLLDADFKAPYNGGRFDLPVPASNAKILLAGTSWKSHFYDPDTQQNYEGEESPTAYTETNAHAKNALAGGLGTAESCYELGLALHFYTDLTQPMHAANFTFKNRPVGLHSNLEGYAVEIQDRYTLSDWGGTPAANIDAWVVQTARDSKALHAATLQAITAAYKDAHARRVRWCEDVDAAHFYERQYVDSKRCWSGNAGVDEAVGGSLKGAQDHTAQYLYLLAQELPSPTAD
jgi:phospholipase C